MYKLRNISKGKVIIKDLGITFSHDEEKDLDTIVPRQLIQNSIYLKKAISGKFLSEPQDDHQTEVELSTPVDLSDIEKRLKDHITQHLSNQRTASPDINNKLDLLFQLISQNKQNPVEIDEAEYAVDDDKIMDIHVKALKRLTENTETHIDVKGNSVESDVLKRADELDDIV